MRLQAKLARRDMRLQAKPARLITRLQAKLTHSSTDMLLVEQSSLTFLPGFSFTRPTNGSVVKISISLQTYLLKVASGAAEQWLTKLCISSAQQWPR